MLKIGLTGGIGSGKSTVSKFLKEQGIFIIDADVIAREVLKLYPQIVEEVKKQFGKNYFDKEGNLDRLKFGNFIFKNIKEREKYEDIIMPFIKKEIFKRIEQEEKRGKELIVLDAPTLIENSMHKDMDINILVWVDKDTQIQRVKDRDSLSEQEIKSRINSQLPLDEKRKLVNFIIDNSGLVENTEIQVQNILRKL